MLNICVGVTRGISRQEIIHVFSLCEGLSGKSILLKCSMHFRTSHSKVTMCSCQVECVDWDCAPFGVNPASQVNANECGVLCARLFICGP